jgi:hypothetical protein
MNLYQPTITGSLSVSGSVNISGSITIAGGGTISGTASIATTALTASFVANAQTASYVLNAVSSSFALTASSADNLLVRNTLTAQTLVVQTITSSVDFVTGSTRFGSILANTHIFSGSVTMNPGGLFVSSSGLVGIGNVVPAYTLDVSGTGRFTNFLKVSGNNALGASSIGGMEMAYFGAEAKSRIIIGDGTGYTLSFSKRTGSANTDLFTITDAGAATFSSSVTATGAINSGGDITANDTSVGSTFLYLKGNATTGVAGVRFARASTGAQMGKIDYDFGTDLMTFRAGGNDRMYITSGGDLMVGTGTAAARLHVYTGDAGSVSSQAGTVAIFENNGHTRVQLQSPDTYSPCIYFSSPTYPLSGQIDQYVAASNVAYMGFSQGGTERMRIGGTGFTRMSNDGTYLNTTSPYHEIVSNQANNATVIITNRNSSTPYGVYCLFNSASPNDSTRWFYNAEDSTATRFTVRSNGGIANYQANDANLSDERTKKDITPLESYWNKFKAIEIVKFKYKDQTHDDFNIGVIAQQVEEIAPEFVDVDGFGETPEDGIPYKTIYTSDLHHTTIKVLQEAMTKIETLQAEFDEYKTTHP